MTPEQKKELKDALRECDRHFQRELGADVPAQLSGQIFYDEGRNRMVETWRAVIAAIKTLDAAFESHQRIRDAAGHVIDQLEGR